MKKKQLTYLVPVMLVILSIAVAIGSSLAAERRQVKRADVGIRPLGNNNWQLSCHYTYNDKSTSDRRLGVVNTNDVKYGDNYSRFTDECKV